MLDVPRKIVAWNSQARKLGRRKVSAVNKIGGSVNKWVYDRTQSLLDVGKMPVVLGGDHSVPFGAILAYAETHPNLGILHLDAHADLRDAYEGFTFSHASIMHNVIH